MLCSTRRLVTPILALILVLSAPAVHAQIFVKHDAGGLNDGSSWLDAYTDLQDALAAAGVTDEIWVAAGVYTPDPSDSTVSFDLPNGVELYGGFDGTEVTRGERDWALNVTTLSGEIGAPDSTDNSYNVVTCTGGGSDTVLDGFTVTGAVSDPVTREGGGMRIVGSSVTVANVIFYHNSSLQDGGGVYLNGGSPTFTSVDFLSNSAGSKEGSTTHSGYGGGVLAIDASPTFDNCNFNANILPFEGGGGGFYSYGTGTATFTSCDFDGNDRDGISSLADAVVTDCTFINNTRDGMNTGSGSATGCTASSNGSRGIRVNSGSITGCTAENNSGGGLQIGEGTVDDCVSRYNDAGQGAGIYVNDAASEATISNCEFVGNTAVFSGGGGYASGSAHPTYINCFFINNSAQGSGGLAARGDVINSVFVGNSATFSGGAVGFSGCGSILTNVTIYGNSAGSDGGAISGCDDVYNSIVWNNGFNPVINDPTFYSSLVEGSGGSSSWDSNLGVDGGGNIDVDPVFVDEGGGNVRLSLGSPAIDAGDDGAPNLSSPDLGGNARIAGAAVDMGAWEFHCPAGSRVYVDADATGADTGDSWTDAYTTLTQALAVACTTVTEIWVAEGTYTPTAGDDRSMTFQLRSGVAVYGGFAGGETTLSQRDIGVNATTLSGEIATGSLDDNSFHVITGSGADTSAVIDGFTVTAGQATGGYPNDRGAGMMTVQGAPAARNLVFVANRAYNGGAVANLFGDIELTNVAFYNNSALSNSGGAIYNSISSPTLTNVTASGNSALASGDGIYNNSSNPVLINVILWGNNGDEMFNASSTPQISNSLIQGSGGSTSWNSAFGSDGGGNIDDDPLFVNAGTGNLRLGPGSPAIDTGSNGAPNLLAIDLDGNPRIDGGTVDMGAYEAVVASSAGDTPRPIDKTAIRSVYPNPFNPSTTAFFDLEQAGRVDVSVYDVRGRLVRRLIHRHLPAGPHQIQWDGRNGQDQRVASGIYILRLDAAGASDQRKLVLLK